MSKYIITPGKKITLTTVKKFIKENIADLYINQKSTFDGSIDGLAYNIGGFQKVEADNDKHTFHATLGIKKAWFVGSSRDHFSLYDENGYHGITVSNSCGTFILAIVAIKKAEKYVLIENNVIHTDDLDLQSAEEMLERHKRIFPNCNWSIDFQSNNKNLQKGISFMQRQKNAFRK